MAKTFLVLVVLFVFALIAFAGHDGSHVREHLDLYDEHFEVPEEDMEYYYFSVHDLNGDGYLDGNELIQLLVDFHEARTTEEYSEAERKVDKALEDWDFNNDGYLDYSEFQSSGL